MKTIKNQLRLIFPSLSENEGLARLAVSGFLAAEGADVSVIAELKTAVSEGVTNAIVHGYRGTQGRIDIIVRLLPEREIYIRIKDAGCGISDVKQAMTPLFTTAPEEERSGLGFSVMQSFMDRLTVRSAPDKGTTVTMRKRLSAHGD
jgi:stage II sporulation protein AB (anti-sigma F factor)